MWFQEISKFFSDFSFNISRGSSTNWLCDRFKSSRDDIEQIDELFDSLKIINDFVDTNYRDYFAKINDLSKRGLT